MVATVTETPPPESKFLPLAPIASAGFIENKGQFSNAVRFQFRTPGTTIWITAAGLLFDVARPPATPTLPPSTHTSRPSNRGERYAFAADFVDADLSRIEARVQSRGDHHYFGSSGTEKAISVKGFEELHLREIWPGIDLRLLAKENSIEQEFLLRPGADPRRILVSYRAVNSMRIDGDGALVVETPVGRLRETSPLVYQMIGGSRRVIPARFRLTSASQYTFEIAEYDPTQPLVVDPTILFSTFFGGSASDHAYSVSTDTSGNVFVTGRTSSSDFPTTLGSSTAISHAIFISKVNPSGSALVWSTYISSPPPWTNYLQGTSVAVDKSGFVYIAGWDGSAGTYPTTPNRYQSCGGNGSLFVTKFSPSGDSMLYSSCLGGNYSHLTIYVTQDVAVAADNDGRAYVVASSMCGFPTTANAYQRNCHPAPIEYATDAVVAVFDTKASGAASLPYATYLGGSWTDFGTGVALDPSGNILVSGSTRSPDFPVTAGAFQQSVPSKYCRYYLDTIPCNSGFVSKINPSLSGAASLIYSTRLGSGADGSTEDYVYAIASDAAGSAYVTGFTTSSVFPTTPGALQSASSGYHAFVSKLDPAGSKLLYSTYLGGTNGSAGYGIAVDLLGNAHVVGSTSGASFPVTPDAFQKTYSKSGGSSSGFFLKLNSSGSSLLYSSYLGGSKDDGASSVALDHAGDAIVVGYTTSPDFPILGSGYQPVLRGTQDAFLTKFPLGDVFRVLGLSISQGGNVGSVTPTVFGSGFHAGATATLLGPASVPSTQSSVGSLGRFLYPTFNLVGAPPGLYSVSITNPDGASQVLPNSFTVEAGGLSDIRVDVQGRTVMRGGREQAYTINLSNRGTADKAPGRFWVTFPSFLEWSILSGSPPITVGKDSDSTYLGFEVSRVAAGETVPFVLGLTLPDTPGYGHLAFQIKTWKDGL